MSNLKVTPPTVDPNKVYPQVEGIDYPLFQLSADGTTPENRAAALAELLKYETTQRDNFLGYQANQKLDYTDLSTYLDYQLNNIGDPFVEGNFTVNCKFAERAVLDYFASLWNARWPHCNKDQDEGWRDSYWGYVTSMGATEGNVYGLWNARDYLAGRFLLVDNDSVERAKEISKNTGRPVSAEPRLNYYKATTPKDSPNAYTPVAFYSQDTHYSIVKAMRVLTIATFNEIGSGNYTCPLVYPDDYPEGFSPQYLDKNGWPLEVPSNNQGLIYRPALAKLVEFFAALGYPILVNFNVGTTFKGAYDDVQNAISDLVPILKKYGLYERKVIYDPDTGKFDIRAGYWFHVDGALGAAYLPFCEMASITSPIFDFRIREVSSISMSGHKWLGAPWPCAVYMTKVKYQLTPPDDPMYIGSPDSTFAGSRNGFSSLILWDYLSKNSYADLVTKAKKLEKLAEYAYLQFLELQKELGQDLWVERSINSLAIRFKKANAEITHKYSLSGEDLYVNGELRSYSHIYIMESATQELIDKLIEDLRASNAFATQQEAALALNGVNIPDENRGLYVPISSRGFK